MNLTKIVEILQGKQLTQKQIEKAPKNNVAQGVLIPQYIKLEVDNQKHFYRKCSQAQWEKRIASVSVEMYTDAELRAGHYKKYIHVPNERDNALQRSDGSHYRNWTNQIEIIPFDGEEILLVQRATQKVTPYQPPKMFWMVPGFVKRRGVECGLQVTYVKPIPKEMVTSVASKIKEQRGIEKAIEFW